MKEVSDDLKRKALKCSMITIVVLIALIVSISFYRKSCRTIFENGSSDLRNIQERLVFDDIKIKINSDIFSYDQIYNEVKENDLISYFKKNLNKGDTILYVSQDIGVQQLLLAKLVSQAGRVYVLNPFEKYNNTIELSAKANGFENRIFTKTVAVSDKSFDGLLVYKNDESPENGMVKSAEYKLMKGYSALKVKVSTLDEIYPNLQNVNLLRISTKKDVFSVIKGAQYIIKRSPKIKIILDYDRNIMEDISTFDDFKALGFNIYLIGADGEISSAEFDKITKGHILLEKK